VSPEDRELERQSRIESLGRIVADVAEELLDSDSGAGCIQAALVCWSRRYGKEAASILVRTALLAVSGEFDPVDGQVA